MNMSLTLIRGPRARTEDVPETADHRIAVSAPVLALPERDSARGANNGGQTKNDPPHAFEKDMA